MKGKFPIKHAVIAFAVVAAAYYFYQKQKAKSAYARSYAGFSSNTIPPIGYGTGWAPLTDPGVAHQDQSNTLPFFNLSAPKGIDFHELKVSGGQGFTPNENPPTYSQTGFS